MEIPLSLPLLWEVAGGPVKAEGEDVIFTGSGQIFNNPAQISLVGGEGQAPQARLGSILIGGAELAPAY